MKANKLVPMLKILASGAVLSVFFSTNVFASNATITGTDINVRAASNKSSNILGKLDNNADIEVLDKSGEYFKIQYKNSVAYVSSEFVMVNVISATVNTDGVNIRATAQDDGEIIGQIDKGEKITLKSGSGEFFLFDYNGKNAYIHENFVDSSLKSSLKKIAPTVIYLAVAKENSPFYAEADKDSQLYSNLHFGDILDVIESSEYWIKAKHADGTIGYIEKANASVRTGVKPSRSLSPSKNGDSVITTAKKYLGTRYVYGGTNLKTGVDCSGFVYSIYKKHGISLNRSSKDMPNNGVSVSKDNLVAGDLVFFGLFGSKGIAHVGIYIGDDKFIHSASNKGVIVSSLNENYYQTNYKSAARVLR